MGELHGAHAVVTGAASGIGRAFAIELGRRGGRVVVSDIDRDGLQQTASLVEQAGGRARVEPCDVREPAQLEALRDAAVSWEGALDLVVLNAGVLAAGNLVGTSAADLDRLFAVNVMGVAHGCRIFGATMVQQGRGALLNVASVAGLIPVPHIAAYSATKAAVVKLSESLYGELRPRGVSVTVLCPSFTRTAIVASGSSSDDRIRGIGQTVIDKLGARPERVVEVGLRAAARGKLYAIDTLHARAAWWLARAAPGLVTRVAAFASGRLP